MADLRLVIVAAATALLTPWAEGRGEPVQSARDIAGRLKVYRAGVKGVSCSFRQTRTPTAYYIESAAREGGVSPEAVKNNFADETRCEYTELADGRYYARISKVSGGGKSPRHDVVVFDGKKAWKQTKVPLENDPSGKEYRDSITEIGGSAPATIYAMSVSIKEFFGFAVLPSDKPLDELIVRGNADRAVERENVDGAECFVVQYTAEVNGAEQRNTLWLDGGHGLAVRKAVQEYNVPGKGWLKEKESKTLAFGEAVYRPGGGEAVTVYYPKNIISETFNAIGGQKTFDSTLEVDELTFNPRVSPDRFALKVDEGTGVMDVDTGRYAVHGNGPGPKLKKLVTERIEESKRQASALLPETSGVQKPPESILSLGAWVALALGLLGLGVAVSLRLMRSRGRPS